MESNPDAGWVMVMVGEGLLVKLEAEQDQRKEKKGKSAVGEELVEEEEDVVIETVQSSNDGNDGNGSSGEKRERREDVPSVCR